MSTLLGIKERLKEIYAKYSLYIGVVLRFALGLLIFGLINTNIGFMKTASSALVTVGLSVICAFLPLSIIVIASTALVLLHLSALSLPVAFVSAIFFMLMYIFYFRLTAKHAWLALLVTAGFALKVPLVVPVAIGLIGTPACLVPAVCGTFTYYMLEFIKTSASSYKDSAAGIEGIIDGVMTFTKQSIMNREMWVMAAAVLLCSLVVYGIKKQGIDHSWKIATGAGVITAIVIAVGGNVVLNLHIPTVVLVVSGILAVGVGLLLEVVFLSVDYLRTEQLEFEDDEYHYYVKAVPKVGVTIPEKSVKHIVTAEQTENLLLTRSLNKELGLNEEPKEN